MVWIYGGGFTGGSGSMPWYDGEQLAAKGPVIVTFNYRLGPFGFFAHPDLAKEAGHPGSGNYGMMDAIAMLKWVEKNINAFGGDPSNVTIFGESAGAIMIGGLVGSPQAKGLFHRAIAESGAWMGLTMAKMTTTDEAQGRGAKAMEAAGIKTMAELRAKPVAELPQLGGAGSSSTAISFPRISRSRLPTASRTTSTCWPVRTRTRTRSSAAAVAAVAVADAAAATRRRRRSRRRMPTRRRRRPATPSSPTCTSSCIPRARRPTWRR